MLLKQMGSLISQVSQHAEFTSAGPRPVREMGK